MKTALAAKAIGKTASASLTVGVAGVVGIAGIVIPLRISGALGPASAVAESEPEVTPSTPDHVIVHNGLKDLVGSAGAVIAVHDDPQPHVVFWRDDVHDLGVVNADEVLVLAHHRLLETLVVYTWDEELTGRRLPTHDVFSDAFLAHWRRNPAVAGAVVATGLADARFSWTETDGGDGELSVRLIWGPLRADAGHMRREPETSVSAFTASVPALRRVR